MSNSQNLINSSLITTLKRLINQELRTLAAFSGNITFEPNGWSIEIGVEAMLYFVLNNTDAIQFHLNIQGDDYPVTDGQHIGLKFESRQDSFSACDNYRFKVNFSDIGLIKKITFWSFAWRESKQPKIINDVVFSLQDGRNFFIHLGSTSDATVLIREQSIESYFEKKNEYYDYEFELVELVSVN